MTLGQKLHTINRAFISDENRYKEVLIKDIPIMVNELGEVVCIPVESEVFSAGICGTCFGGETLIRTKEGYKEIKKMDIGDEVLSFDAQKKKLVFNQVIQKFIYSGLYPLVELKLKNGRIICTQDHKFYKNGKWIRAIDIARRIMEGDSRNQWKIFNQQFWKTKGNELEVLKKSKNNEIKFRQRIPKNNDIKKQQVSDSCDSQISCKSIYPKSKKKDSNKSYRQQSFKQSGKEFRMGNSKRKCSTLNQNRNILFCDWRKEWDGNSHSLPSKRNKSKIYSLRSYKKKVSEGISHIGSSHKENSKQKNLEAREIDFDEIIEIKIFLKKLSVYDLKVDNTSNYCVTRKNIIVHNSGVGKTMLLNRLLTGIYYQWEANCAIMNDLSNETFKWSEPMTNWEFNEDNWNWVHQKPIPSPIVYLFPNSNTSQIPIHKLSSKPYIKTILPFKEIMDKLGFFLKGVLPDFDLGKSAMYVDALKEKLIACETPEQIKEVLEEELPGADGKNFKAMRIKIITAFDALMKEEILDITNPECHAQVKLGTYLGNPLSAIMKAKSIPSLITSNLIEKRYKSEVFAYYMDLLFQNNLKDFPNEKTFLFFDELREVATKEDEPASEALSRISARGRINNVGLIFATQFYNLIPQCVKGAKLNYCFVFAHSNTTILNEIGNDFDLDRDIRKQIKNLPKFECIALTHNKFACYKEGDRYETTKPQKGRILYPLANHHRTGGD